MLKIKDSVSVGLLFNGVEFPLETSSFRTITVHNLTRLILPTISINLIDNSAFFANQVPIEDGVKIELQLSDGSDQANLILRFRIWNFKSSHEGGINSYIITGYYDSPLMMHQAATRPIRATSSSALQQIAEQAGLKFEGDSTNDLQTWIPANSRYLVFAQEIAKHGYLNDRSFMKMAVTMGGKLRYKDLSKLNTNSVSGYFVHDDPIGRSDGKSVYQVYSADKLASSGFQNSRGGYAHAVVTQSVMNDPKTIDSLEVKRLTENLMQNEEVSGSVDRSRVDIRPIDCGNVHENYESAYYQNFRNSLVYAFGVQLMILEQSGLDLFDLVNYTSYTSGNQSPELSETFSAAYLVTGKIIHIQVGNYFEKFLLHTTGLNKEVVDDGSI